ETPERPLASGEAHRATAGFGEAGCRRPSRSSLPGHREWARASACVTIGGMDTRERPAFQSSAMTSMVRGGGVDIEVAPPGALRTEELILSIGPQHPPTPG